MKKDNFKIDFIGVGAPRSGTTWLAKCLEEHPQICFAKEKEPTFFNKKYFFCLKKWAWRYAAYGLEWYKKHFSHYQPGQIRGEFSVVYLYDLDTPELIHRHFPQTRIIISLRNPTDMLYSFYTFLKYVYTLPLIEELIKTNKEFVEYGFYAQFIERYLKYFKRDRVLILIYDDLKKDPASFVKKVYRFLEVDEKFIPSCINKMINPAGLKATFEAKCYYGARNRARKSWGKKLADLPRLKSVLVWFDIVIMCPILTKMGKRKKKYRRMPAHIKNTLDKIYLPEIKKLEKFIDRDLGCWIK